MDVDSLLERARSKDRDAFLALVQPHQARIWTIIRTVTQSRADAEDLAQDVHIKAFLALPRYSGDTTLLGAWLARIAVNTAHDWQRSGWIRRVLRGGDDALPERVAPQSDPALLVEQAEQRRRLRAAVVRLPERQRVPLHLVYFEGCTIAEAARLEGVAETTLRSRMEAGLRRLERSLGEGWEESRRSV